MDNPFEATFSEYYEAFLAKNAEDDNAALLKEIRELAAEDPEELVIATMGITFATLILTESGLLPEDLSDTLDKYGEKFEDKLLEIVRGANKLRVVEDPVE